MSSRYEVVPFAVETYGAMCKEARALTDTLSKKAKEASGDSRARSLFYQRVQAAVQGGNARTIVGHTTRTRRRESPPSLTSDFLSRTAPDHLNDDFVY